MNHSDDCTIDTGCQHHNLYCSYPRCDYGIANRKKAESKLLTKLEVAQERELEFLRYFYTQAGYAFEAGGADVYQMIIDDFKDRGGILPKGYEEDE